MKTIKPTKEILIDVLENLSDMYVEASDVMEGARIYIAAETALTALYEVDKRHYLTSNEVGIITDELKRVIFNTETVDKERKPSGYEFTWEIHKMLLELSGYTGSYIEDDFTDLSSLSSLRVT